MLYADLSTNDIVHETSSIDYFLLFLSGLVNFMQYHFIKANPFVYHPGDYPMHSTTTDLYRDIVETAPDAILFADREGLIRFWNGGAERIFQIPREQALGRSLDLIIPEKLRLRHWEGYRRVMAGEEPRYGTQLLRVPALKGDGTRFSSEFSIVMVKDGVGKILGVAAILRDVSAQWQRERELKAQMEELSRDEGKNNYVIQ